MLIEVEIGRVVLVTDLFLALGAVGRNETFEMILDVGDSVLCALFVRFMVLVPIFGKGDFVDVVNPMDSNELVHFFDGLDEAAIFLVSKLF